MKSQNQLVRQGILEAASTLDQTQVSAQQPPSFTYVPPTHARALDPEATLVEGMRGAGKSFWWSLLASTEHREFVQANYPEAQLPSSRACTASTARQMIRGLKRWTSFERVSGSG